MLLLAIEEEEKQNFDIKKNILDELKYYINPSMYEQEKENEMGKNTSWEKINSEFAEHSNSGRATGKPKLSPELAQAVFEFRDLEKEGVQMELGMPEQKEDEENTLG